MDSMYKDLLAEARSHTETLENIFDFVDFRTSHVKTDEARHVPRFPRLGNTATTRQPPQIKTQNTTSTSWLRLSTTWQTLWVNDVNFLCLFTPEFSPQAPMSLDYPVSILAGERPHCSP
jgi:hypothetical protein